MICSKCNQKQFSLFDRKYLEVFDICWECDKELQSTEILEEKEMHAYSLLTDDKYAD